MAWRAFDRAVKSVEALGADGPLARWCTLRAHIRADVCANGYDAGQNTFVQYYGGKAPDASLLIIPLVGFLPAGDARMVGTVAAIGRDLTTRGLVRRYAEDAQAVDGLPAGEGTFLPLSFLYAANLALQGRRVEAVALFERLLLLSSDVGLFAEEYDPVAGCMLGNFPQALTHVAVINTALTLDATSGPAGPA